MFYKHARFRLDKVIFDLQYGTEIVVALGYCFDVPVRHGVRPSLDPVPCRGIRHVDPTEHGFGYRSQGN